MQVKQIYEITNEITKEILGEEAVLKEDLSNLVDTGKEIQNVQGLDNYVRKLVDRIAKVVFVARKYSGSAPSVLMDSWEYGSIVEKIRAELPEATENESWELQDGQSYDQDVFYQPKVSVKFFNSKTTFEIPMSFTENQVKSAFANATQMNAFMSMILNAIENSMTMKLDALIMRTINNFIAETIHNANGNRAVNLLSLYNATQDSPIDVADAIRNPEFIRFATMQMNLYKKRLAKPSKLFNIGGKDTVTTEDRLHVVMLAEFVEAADVYLQSDVFHNEYTGLPNAETVPYWQGSGTDYAFTSTSKINVKTSENNNVEQGGILGVMFDREALGVSNLDRRTTTHYNGKAEFWNNWFKADAGYFNDFDENFVVFYIAS